jgi:hypothetical protein
VVENIIINIFTTIFTIHPYAHQTSASHRIQAENGFRWG